MEGRGDPSMRPPPPPKKIRTNQMKKIDRPKEFTTKNHWTFHKKDIRA